MKKKSRIKHTYGSDRYKGFVLVKNKDGSLNKHYIAAASYDHLHPGNVFLSIESSHDNQEHFNYKLGTNTYADIGIKTWYRNREKNHMSVGAPNEKFDDWCHTNIKLKKNRKRKKK